MGRLTLTPAVQEAIRQQGEAVELTDAGGQLVGYYLSPSVYQKLLYQYANSLVTDAELEESRRSSVGRTTEEVLARLTSLSPS